MASVAVLGNAWPAGRMPTEPEFEQALAEAQPAAHAAGLRLRRDGLWLTQLRARTPLLAVRHGQDCHIGFSAYTPGVQMDWLFPDGPPAMRALWLAGLLRHELTHCLLQDQTPTWVGPQAAANPDADPGTSPVPPAISGASLAWRQEALADLAFALHVDTQPGGTALIEHLAQWRARRAASDPVHDASAVLQCYLQHPQRQAQAEPALNALHTLWHWHQRCLPG